MAKPLINRRGGGKKGGQYSLAIDMVMGALYGSDQGSQEFGAAEISEKLIAVTGNDKFTEHSVRHRLVTKLAPAEDSKHKQPEAWYELHAHVKISDGKGGFTDDPAKCKKAATEANAILKKMNCEDCSYDLKDFE